MTNLSNINNSLRGYGSYPYSNTITGSSQASGTNPAMGQNPDGECQTCKNRKYVDGSDEMVSFKTPSRISPERAATAVRAHEQEHVNNAYTKAAKNNGKVMAANVSLKTSICPECGRSYIAGGTTQTQIKYYNEENPYQQDLKATDNLKYKGMNADYSL